MFQLYVPPSEQMPAAPTPQFAGEQADAPPTATMQKEAEVLAIAREASPRRPRTPTSSPTRSLSCGMRREVLGRRAARQRLKTPEHPNEEGRAVVAPLTPETIVAAEAPGAAEGGRRGAGG